VKVLVVTSEPIEAQQLRSALPSMSIHKMPKSWWSRRRYERASFSSGCPTDQLPKEWQHFTRINADYYANEP
jgi:hypothetical protein